MRLVTRGNSDGLACAVLLSEVEQIDSIELIHPQDITDGRFTARPGDILANLPYHAGCSKWFDHHAATRTYDEPPEEFEGRHEVTASTSRVVYDYYLPQHPQLARFEKFIQEVDRFDSAELTEQDILDPQGVILLAFTMDSRTGLGAFKDYFHKLLGWLRSESIEQVLQQPEVQELAKRMAHEREAFLEVMRRHSRLEGNVIVTDLREAGQLPAGNRFLVYTLFPEANVSVRLTWGPERRFVVATLGHNIFNRPSQVHVGRLLKEYGGGGHVGAGATPLDLARADELAAEIVQRLQDTPAG